MDSELTQCSSLTWKKRYVSFQPSSRVFASTFEKQWGCWRVHGAAGMLEELTGDAVYAFSLPFSPSLHYFWEPFPFSLPQDTVTPNARLSQNTGFPLLVPQISLSFLHSTMADVQPFWRRESLGWRKGLMGTACPRIAGGPNCPLFGLQWLIPISASTSK